jgi:hypothetical protein
MFCPKCNKFYYKKSYFDKHIRTNDCIKKIISIDYKHSRITTELLLAQINSLHDRITNLEEALSKVSSTPPENSVILPSSELDINQDKRLALIVYKNINPNRAIKNEKIQMDPEIVGRYLSYKEIESDCELLGKYYFDDIQKEDYPLKKDKKNDSYFWNGDEWIEDNGTNLKSIISNNLRKLYTKINVISEEISNPNYLENQEHINKINTKKYQMKLYNLFMEKYCGKSI